MRAGEINKNKEVKKITIILHGKNPNILCNIIDKVAEHAHEIFIIGKPFKVDESIKNNIRNVKFIKENDLASSIIKCFEISNGDYIALLNGELKNFEKCVAEMKEIIENGADLVIGKRKNKSSIAKIFVNLLFPKSRIVDDPLSEIFMFRREVIKDIKIRPLGSKILLEILHKGKYENVKEIPIHLKNAIKTKESYSKYSRHLLKIAWKEGEIHRFFKFGIVGGSGVLLNEFLLWLLLKYNFFLILASLISVETSILWTFLLNELWTFKDRGQKKLKEYLKRLGKFNFACLVGLSLNVIILLMLVKIGIHPLKANIVGISVAFIWNFFAHNLWTWYE